jgi:hypothetical protein
MVEGLPEQSATQAINCRLHLPKVGPPGQPHLFCRCLGLAYCSARFVRALLEPGQVTGGPWRGLIPDKMSGIGGQEEAASRKNLPGSAAESAHFGGRPGVFHCKRRAVNFGARAADHRQSSTVNNC